MKDTCHPYTELAWLWPMWGDAATVALAVLAPPSPEGPAQHIDGERRLSVALVEQPFVSNGASAGPTTMAAAIGFAAIPPADPGGLSIAALNRLILGAVRGLAARATPIIPGRF